MGAIRTTPRRLASIHRRRQPRPETPDPTWLLVLGGALWFGTVAFAGYLLLTGCNLPGSA